MSDNKSEYIEKFFPNLKNTYYQITSPQTRKYNCIAWAASDQKEWWWPIHSGYWPEGAPRENTVRAFIIAYGLLGYSICDNGELEIGFEKIALYTINGVPSHAARQLDNGNWTSKLGPLEDIEHTLEGLIGDMYGVVTQFLKRPRG